MADIVKPVVRLFFPCDEAIIDLADEKWILKNPWHTVAMPPGILVGHRQKHIWLYAQFTGGVGSFRLSVHLFDELGRRVGRSEPSSAWELSGGNEVYEEVFHLENVPFCATGLVRIQVDGQSR